MRRRSALWIPLVLVGSVVYWTLALGLGGVSLALLGVSGDELELRPSEVVPPRVASGEPIMVHLQSWNDADTASDDDNGVLEPSFADPDADADADAVPVTLEHDDQAHEIDSPGRTAY